MADFVIVTPNPAVDVTYRVAEQRIGETVRVTDVRRAAGGKGINVASVLTQLGRSVIAVHPLGGDSGEWMRNELARRGILADAVVIRGDTRTTIAVADGLAHPTLLAEPGPALNDAEWADLVARVRRAASVDGWVVVAGSFPPGTHPDRLTVLVDAAHSTGARVLVDTAGPLLLTAARAGADIVKANRDEIAEATATGWRDGARTLAASGSSVVVSLGADGVAWLKPPDRWIEQHAVPAVSGNPTGAGDAATAGLVAALAAGLPRESALAWASACGAAAVLSPVAGHLDLDDLEALAARLPHPPQHPLFSTIGSHPDGAP